MNLHSKWRNIVTIFLTLAMGEAAKVLNICLVLESDSFYVTYTRLEAALDLAVTHSNAYILPKSIQVQVTYQDAGECCTQIQYKVVSNVMNLLNKGIKCDLFLGASCATTALSLYGIADGLNTAIIGIPAVGVPALALNSSEEYFKLLIRPAFGFGDFSFFFMELLSRFNYSHLTFFRDDSLRFFSDSTQTIINQFKIRDEVLFHSCLQISFFSQSVQMKEVDRMLDDASAHSRVIVLMAHASAVRMIMIRAYERGMTNGEFVYFAVELFDLDYWGKISYSNSDLSDADAMHAFSSLIVLGLHKDTETNYNDEFEERMKRLAHDKYNYTFNALQQIDPVLIGHYESIIMYAQEVKLMEQAGLDYTDGNLLASQMRGSTYDSIVGSLIIGLNGIRARDYEVRMFDEEHGKFEATLVYLQHTESNNSFRLVRPVRWPSLDRKLPPDEPLCGFLNNKCRDDRLPIGILAVAIVIPLIVFFGLVGGGAFMFIKLKSLRGDYNPNWWRINSQLELTIKQTRTGSRTSKGTLQSKVTIQTKEAEKGILVASFKGILVSLTEILSLAKHVTPDMIIQFNLLKGITHGNLQKFIGVGLTNEGLCEFVVAELCSKGCLTDILHNEAIKLDWFFKNSFIKDIVFGMSHLHATAISSHGNLTSNTCLIDTRFTLKISDFGLPCFRDPKDMTPATCEKNPDRQYEILLWRAPELLRQIMPPQGTQRGDVYSFAVILQQIILRSGPFELPSDPLELSDKEIVLEVASAAIPPVRPRVPRSACSNELYDLMERCWEEIPVERPTFLKIKERLRKVVGDVGDNIVDLLFKRMEQYANDLELKVAEKTQQFMDEKNRSEQLLSELLPKPVASALTRGEHVDPEAYESVTIFFSDIVGFTTIAAAGSPMDVISLLNSLYTFFDSILEKFDVYKVETIGDAYMVSSGLPVRNGNRHAGEIANMSIELVKGIQHFVVPHRPSEHIEIRIGANSGPCVAGIVGIKMPRYCLFGDTVNVASRMESTGEPMKIHISRATKDLLESIGGYLITPRGPVTVKGKGVLNTFWLIPAL